MTEYQKAIQRSIDEDWELVKDTAGTVSDQRTVFDLAYRFGWHAAHRYFKPKTEEQQNPYANLDELRLEPSSKRNDQPD